MSKDIVQHLRAFVTAYEKNNPLRTADMHSGDCDCLRCQSDWIGGAADRIEALEAEVKELREVWHKQVDVASAYFNECEALKAEVAALKIACKNINEMLKKVEEKGIAAEAEVERLKAERDEARSERDNYIHAFKSEHKNCEAAEAEVAALKSQLHEAREDEKAAGKAYDEVLLTKDAMRDTLQAAEAEVNRLLNKYEPTDAG